MEVARLLSFQQEENVDLTKYCQILKDLLRKTTRKNPKVQKSNFWGTLRSKMDLTKAFVRKLPWDIKSVKLITLSESELKFGIGHQWSHLGAF